MQSVELSAKTLGEARKAAATKLGVSEEALTVTVLEETKGLFGKSTVRVRAEAEESAASAPVEEAPPSKPAPRARGRKPAAEPTPETVGAPDPVAVPVVEATPEEPSRTRRGRGGKGRNESATAPAEPESAPGGETAEEAPAAAATSDDGEALAGLLRELLESAGMEVSVTLGEINGRYVSLKIDGKDAAYLVGKHGEVLNALQYLVNVVAHRRFNTDARATLDGNDYRKRREDVLTQMASNIAAQVKERGEEAVLDALPAFERRIVHKALQEIDGIQTYSEGEEPNRRVVIAPAD